MKTYALIKNNLVVEIIPPVADDQGQYVPIDERFTPAFVASMVDVTSFPVEPGVGWSYDGEQFSAPVDPPPVDPQIAIDAKFSRLRAVREEILNRLGGIAGRADRKGDKATADACDVATQSLLDITKDLPADLAEIELTVLARYKAIVSTAATAAPSLISAFAGVDL
ncbi:hypothetical protein [Rhodoferax sp.]|uniref:hypothetical protein n=1 Tax=Rhodoferax sp. TaxID=50421 RepID=UPI00283D388B|nr:hypothetical protein [Rhodoferax sp.]MDR3370728.1 hypothetical protein [Rhodoferax sp.]